MDALGQRLAEGEPGAFAELYDRCAPRLHQYLTVLSGSRADADDLLQETFVRLARSRENLRTVANVVAYVHAVARNEFLRQYKRSRGKRNLENPFTGEEIFVIDQKHDAMTQAAEAFADLLTELRPSEREIIVLKTQTGLTFREIAEVTATPQGTVATRYRDAIARLRIKFARHES